MEVIKQKSLKESGLQRNGYSVIAEPLQAFEKYYKEYEDHLNAIAHMIKSRYEETKRSFESGEISFDTWWYCMKCVADFIKNNPGIKNVNIPIEDMKKSLSKLPA